jgi:hypothetical protein
MLMASKEKDLDSIIPIKHSLADVVIVNAATAVVEIMNKVL